jgi:hypothetical protein
MEEASHPRREAKEANKVKAPDAMLIIGYDAQGRVAQIGSWYLSHFVLYFMDSLGTLLFLFFSWTKRG